MVERLFLAVPRGCLQFVIVVFPDHTHLLFFIEIYQILKIQYFIMYLKIFGNEMTHITMLPLCREINVIILKSQF